MSSSFRIAIAEEPLLALAQTAGSGHSAGCAALLDLFATSETLGESLRHELGRAELSPIGFGVLTVLLKQEPTTFGTGELARALDRPPQAISEALARLELAHYLRRARDPANRRQNRVQLTSEGRTIIRNALSRFEATIHRLMSVLSTDEVAGLRRACSRLCSSPSPFQS